MTDKIGIYIHVPFCLSKCHYCDFCSMPRADGEMKQRYVDELCREIDECCVRTVAPTGRHLVADTVYFGGGTPSLLSVGQFEQIMSAVDKNFGILDGAEITAEVNPKTADEKKLSDMRSLGINRLSIGMQSANDNELRALGRIHDFDDFKKCFSDARVAGFDNVSADLMYGIPEQTMESFRNSIKALCDLSPDHISSYCLTIEEGTNFYRRRDALALPDEDTASDMYLEMSNILGNRGYNKYEISNFSRKGRESRHNLKYWLGEEYLGFGAGAHSYFDEIRRGNLPDIKGYIDGKPKIDEETLEYIDVDEKMREYVMLGMRLARGIDFSDFFARFGVEFLQKFVDFKKFSPEYVTVDGNCCRFTEKGMLVSNSVLSDIL